MGGKIVNKENSLLLESDILYEIVIEYLQNHQLMINNEFLPKSLLDVDTNVYEEFILVDRLYQNGLIDKNEMISVISLLFYYYALSMKHDACSDDITNTNYKKIYALSLLRLRVLNVSLLGSEINSLEYKSGLEEIKKSFNEKKTLIKTNNM